MNTNLPLTLLDALSEALQRAGTYNPSDQVAPAVVLWPDKERQWEPLLPELRRRLPLLTLGAYDPDNRTGPAYYLRCMLARTLPEDALPADKVPIIYLPGVSRQDLRAIDECPKPLQPLAALQYRGVLWTHRNGRDWTVAGLMQNAEDGLGIAVGADTATQEALLRALPVMAREPLAALSKQAPLRAPYLNGLLNPDDVRRLLMWMNDPQGYRDQVDQAEWVAFGHLCHDKYGFHPESDGELTAAKLLGNPNGAWQTVWQRFTEAPTAYPRLPDLLRRAKPQQQMALFDASSSPYWPQDNEAEEEMLRAELKALHDKPASDARAAVLALEERHARRREWVWAKLSQSSLARALEHLARLAKLTEQAFGGATVPAIAAAYAESGWRCDAAVLDALAAVETTDDTAAVKGAITPLYRPWLEQTATAFQQAILGNPSQNYVAESLPTPSAGTCILFSDALRFDAARRLANALERHGLACECGWRLAALPTVTATAKAALLPIADRFAAGAPGLVPVIKDRGTPVTAELVRKLMEEMGYQVLMGDATGDPEGLAWTEIGAIDQYGHGHGCKLATHLSAELDALEERIVGLLGAGWQRIQVVTDHGWLLLPGGLPKANLPLHLTQERKGRCAVLKEGASTDQDRVPWHWDHNVSIAVAPGIACYEAGKEYEHGGLSPQECVVPVITVTAAHDTAQHQVAIEQVSWRGLRCRVELTTALIGAWADIRSRAADASTSLVEQPKQIEATDSGEGAVSLLVPDEERLGEAAFLVICTPEGALCAQALTTIGG